MDVILKFVYVMILFLSLFLVVTNVKSFHCHMDYDCYDQITCIIGDVTCLEGSCDCPQDV
ncbi:Nodule Cysteine-Rich (NCR) secreted peptide [Medicago truncatula]|uniref:Nodule Cysteine-Rich (NCR) secreted peptide n=2 Tax=Medicago truncatula TaxID=3880 RepID=A0A072UYP4_MEDTR|nr:Nodule Cysteine-Rich (NCR) secreted peptide [Medicago truncatula]